MRGRWSYAIGLALLATACSQQSELIPGPGALPAPHLAGGAMAEVAGIRVSAAGDAWRGEPSSLEAEVTPVLVRIENNSSHQMVIRYQLFEFENVQRNYEAIPPYDTEATTVQAVAVPAYTLRSFAVAPYLSRYYSRMRAWATPFRYDPAWYSGRYTVWQQVQMPTGDMLRMALPEGVLDPGGVAEGFVYFERITENHPQVSLNMDLMTPVGQNFGTIRIPFQVD